MSDPTIKTVPIGGIGEFTPQELNELLALFAQSEWKVLLRWLSVSDASNGEKALCQTTSHETLMRLQGETQGNRKVSQLRQNALSALEQLRQSAKK